MVAPSVDLDYRQRPFDLLDPDERARLGRSLDLVLVRAGDCLLEEGAASEAVYVIHEGRVRAVRTRDGRQERLGEYAQGDVLGAFAVMMGHARYRYEAVEDSLCFAIAAPAFRAVLEHNTRFAAWFLEGLSVKRRLLAEQERSSDLAELMLARAGDAQLAPAVTVAAGDSLADVRRAMKAQAVSCVLVAPEAGDAGPGIATRTDLLDALALGGMAPSDALRPLVRRPLIGMQAHEVLFQALVTMTERHVERLVVFDGEHPLGTLGMAEVLSHYSSHSHLIGLELARAATPEAVRDAALRMTALVRTLHAQGARMSFLSELVSALNSRIMARLFELLVPEEVRPRVCLLVLGSEGRREQIVKTDQDNALVLAPDLHWPGLDATMAEFSRWMVACGYPPCPGRIMVDNPQWRGTPQQWRERADGWGRSTDPEALMALAIALDARPVAGDEALFEAFRPALYAAARNDVVLHHLARAAIEFHPALTVFGRIRTGGQGTDIKKGGVFPLVHGLRVLALRYEVRDRNSFRRAEAVVAAGGMSAALGRDVQQALAVFLRMRLGRQLEVIRQGEPPDNHLHVDALRRLDRELLRDALAVVDEFKGLLTRTFHL